jgi:hypothetical protein
VLAAQADVVARACASQEAPLVRGVAEKLEAVLAEVPCGFAHGVFLDGNLLVENGRLAGVVDWDTAGLDRPPHVDFLHLGKTSVAAADVAREWLPQQSLGVASSTSRHASAGKGCKKSTPGTLAATLRVHGFSIDAGLACGVTGVSELIEPSLDEDVPAELLLHERATGSTHGVTSSPVVGQPLDRASQAGRILRRHSSAGCMLLEQLGRLPEPRKDHRNSATERWEYL